MGSINQGRYDRLLRRTAAQVGPGSKVGNALEDLFPTLDVENAPIELLRASGWFFGMGRIANTSAAATIPTHQLFNPAGSGRLVVLTKLTVNPGVAATIQYGPAFTALADASVPGAERDTRQGVIRSTVGLLQEEDDGIPSVFGEFQIAANAPLEMADQNGLAVLAPGTAFRLNSTALNITLRTSWMWRERTAEPEELNF